MGALAKLGIRDWGKKEKGREKQRKRERGRERERESENRGREQGTWLSRVRHHL